jgi:hypothetical protein
MIEVEGERALRFASRVPPFEKFRARDRIGGSVKRDVHRVVGDAVARVRKDEFGVPGTRALFELKGSVRRCRGERIGGRRHRDGDESKRDSANSDFNEREGMLHVESGVGGGMIRTG